MTLAELFNAVNLAGVRLANVAGRLELRGQYIPPDVKIGASEHKKTILALLPPDADSQELDDERSAIVAEGEGKVTATNLARALAEWDSVAAEPSRQTGPLCRCVGHCFGWRSLHGAVTCAVCRPPERSELVQN